MEPSERVFTGLSKRMRNFLTFYSMCLTVWVCFFSPPTLSPAVSILYDSGHDLTHTLKKMEEQLLKFAVNVLFNTFDLLAKSHRRPAMAIYRDVFSGVGVHGLCLL